MTLFESHMGNVNSQFSPSKECYTFKKLFIIIEQFSPSFSQKSRKKEFNNSVKVKKSKYVSLTFQQ